MNAVAWEIWQDQLVESTFVHRHDAFVLLHESSDKVVDFTAGLFDVACRELRVAIVCVRWRMFHAREQVDLALVLVVRALTTHCCVELIPQVERLVDRDIHFVALAFSYAGIVTLTNWSTVVFIWIRSLRV